MARALPPVTIAHGPNGIEAMAVQLPPRAMARPAANKCAFQDPDQPVVVSLEMSEAQVQRRVEGALRGLTLVRRIEPSQQQQREP